MRRILVAVPDSTRKAHLKTVLPPILRLIVSRYHGVRASGVTIIAATGLHKPHTRGELKELVGAAVFNKYKVISHSQDKKALARVGAGKKGIPIVLNKCLLEADEVITVGVVEPHLYAGYSGGIKVAAIGLAGEETINATHHPRFLDKPGTAIGEIRGNPFQDCLWEIVRGLPIRYCVNIVNDQRGRLKKVFCGSDPHKSFYGAAALAEKVFQKKIDGRFDAVICKMPAPKGANAYQASRAFNYILNVKRPIVKTGGIVLVEASLEDLFGAGLGEKRFKRALRAMRSPGGFIAGIKKKGCVAGEHRAYLVAKALTKARLGFIGPRAAACANGTGLLAFPDTRSAVGFIKREKGENATIYTNPHGLSAILTR